MEYFETRVFVPLFEPDAIERFELNVTLIRVNWVCVSLFDKEAVSYTSSLRGIFINDPCTISNELERKYKYIISCRSKYEFVNFD